MISYHSLLQETPTGAAAVAWSENVKSQISFPPSLSPSPSIPWLQRKFLIDEISGEWFECIGANYSGNGETLLRNVATPRKCRRGGKRLISVLCGWVGAVLKFQRGEVGTSLEWQDMLSRSSLASVDPPSCPSYAPHDPLPPISPNFVSSILKYTTFES